MPDWKPEILHSLAPLNLDPAREAEIAEELAQHLEDRYEELLASGKTDDEAFQATVEELKAENLLARGLKPVEKKKYREPLVQDVAGRNLFAGVVQDIRFALRMLRKSPGFAAVAVLTLALGIGANTAIFSVVQAVLLRPLPYPQPNQLVQVWNTYPPIFPQGGLSPGDMADWRQQAASFSETAGYAEFAQQFNLTGDGEPQRITVGVASASLFPMLGIRPVAGRLFVNEEDKAGSAPVVLVTHHLWQSRYGGDPAVVGKAIALDDRRYIVVGVLPANFLLQRERDLWLPLGQFPDDLAEHVHHGIILLGRLRPGVTLAQAQAEIETLNRQEAITYPAAHKGFGVKVTPLEDPDATSLRKTLLVLSGAVGFVLLIACANIVNLLLARNAARRRELAVRSALGARRWRLLRQMLTETLLLCAIGGLVGLVLAVLELKLLISFAPAQLLSLQDVHLNLPVLAFTAALCILAGVICAVIPASQALGSSLATTLNEGSKGTGGLGSHRVHGALVISEIALATVPLIAAVLLIRSFDRLLDVNPGFHRDHALTLEIPQAQLSFAEQNAETDQQESQRMGRQALVFEQIAARIQALPGVKGVGGIDVMPLASEEVQVSRFTIEGQPIPPSGALPVVEFRSSSLGYFSTMGIALLRGRLLTQDDWSSTNILINENMAHHFWPEGDPTGKRVNFCTLDPKPCWYQIVGVVGNVHQFGLENPPTYDVYFSGGWKQSLIIRTATDPAVLAPSVVDVIHKVDPKLPVTKVLTMDNLLLDSVAPRRFSMVLVGIFASLALLLSAAGVYGVMSYAVAQRTREIGLRMALGALPCSVLGLIVARAIRLALIGILVGLTGALALAHLLTTLLYGVRPTDPFTFAAVAFVLLLVALLACYLPAHRAMRVDPIVALHYE